MIKISLKDGSIIEVDKGTSIIEVARKISEGLARVTTCGEVDGKIKEERSKKLIELSNENQKMYNQQLVGKEAEVLFEDKEVEDGITYFRGHTQNYVLVKYKTDENLENTLKLIKISDISELPI